MTRMITAMFDTRAEADTAADHLVREVGLHRSAVQIHGGETAAGSARAPAAAASADNDVTFWSALRDLFVPDEDRPTYAEGLRRGSFLVTAEVEDAELERAMDLLESHGAVDLDTREAQWREGGWSGQETVASLPTSPETGVAGTTRETIIERPGGAGGDFTTDPAPGMMDSRPDASRREHETGMAIASGATTPPPQGTAMGHGSLGTKPGGKEDVIQVVEERIQVGKRDVERGRVRVRSYVVERPVNEQVTLRSEHVEVERRRVDRPATSSDDLFRERTIEAVERGEEAVVAKEARVTEEVVLRKDAAERTETVSDTVRRTEVEVEDETPGAGKGTLGSRHRSPAAPDGSPGNPPGTMASRAVDKTLGTNASGANPSGENITDRMPGTKAKPGRP